MRLRLPYACLYACRGVCARYYKISSSRGFIRQITVSKSFKFFLTLLQYARKKFEKRKKNHKNPLAVVISDMSPCTWYVSVPHNLEFCLRDSLRSNQETRIREMKQSLNRRGCWRLRSHLSFLISDASSTCARCEFFSNNFFAIFKYKFYKQPRIRVPHNAFYLISNCTTRDDYLIKKEEKKR